MISRLLLLIGFLMLGIWLAAQLMAEDPWPTEIGFRAPPRRYFWERWSAEIGWGLRRG